MDLTVRVSLLVVCENCGLTLRARHGGVFGNHDVDVVFVTPHRCTSNPHPAPPQPEGPS
jgi:hypothetical protein